MSNEEPRTVWVLGAGFSKGLGGPLIEDLLAHRELPVLERLFGPKEVAEEQLKARLFYRHGLQRRYWDQAEQFLDIVESADAEGRYADVPDAEIQKMKAATFPSHGRQLLQSMLKNTVRWPETQNIEQGNGLNRSAVQTAGPAHAFRSIHDLAVACRRALTADCSLFLRSAQLETELWSPYVNWARYLGPNHTVITFNYDYAPELLASIEGSKIKVVEPTPGVADTVNSMRIHEGKAPVLKVHGSVTWVRRAETIEVLGIDDQALRDPRTDVVIGVPGPGKRSLIRQHLNFLWSAMLKALSEAEQIIFIGYRFPPTDADSRRDILGALRKSARDGSPWVQTVLGPRISSDDSVRLEQLLRRSDVREVHPVPLYAQDYLALWPHSLS